MFKIACASNFVAVVEDFEFYVECPICSRDGKKLGTISIFDMDPWDFSSIDEESLLDLAALI